MSKRSRSPGPVRTGPTESRRGRGPWATWQVMNLDIADFQIYQEDAGVHWTLANTAGGIRATKESTSAKNWAGGTQDGMAIIQKKHVSPWVVGIPGGFSDEKWRTGHAVFRSQAKFVFGSDIESAPAQIHGGPAIVTYTNDQSGTPAGPAFAHDAAQPSWYAHAQTTTRETSRPDQWNAAWSHIGGSDWIVVGGGDNSPEYGNVDSGGNADQTELSTGITYPGEDREYVHMAWQDSSAPATAPKHTYRLELDPGTDNNLKLDGKYLHPAFFFASWGTGQIGDWVELVEWRIMVQQLPTRGSQ